jgi:hypothetical protein
MSGKSLRDLTDLLHRQGPRVWTYVLEARPMTEGW